MYQRSDTIAALSTPPGEGAIAVVRISGPKALEIGEAIFTGPVKSYSSYTAHYGQIVSGTGEAIDSVLLLPMRGPRSYTGEDTVEISCHGGSLISRKVLSRAIEAGARPAQPGEFSLRAFLNGKLDLAQAEAVQQLIGAKSELALKAAEQQLEGRLSERVASFQKELLRITAIVEAWVDFPEEGLEFASQGELLHSLGLLIEEMEKLKKTFHQGRRLSEGISLCLIGAPNVGKSSLMNALLGKERAIVTEIAGTTRDLIEEDLRLGSLHFRLIDTAGIRETEERVEQEGIRRSKEALDKGDLILFLLDASRGLNEEELALIEKTPKEKTLFVWNKSDLSPPPLLHYPAIAISAKENQGLEKLLEAIEERVWQGAPPSKEEVLLTSLRHFEALQRAIGALQEASRGLREGRSPEFLTSDLRSALHELGNILGLDVTEEILTSIFSQFCLGK
mgnify:CR=1 FL=1